MTLRKSNRSPEDILFELIGRYPGNAEAVAERLGISVKTLYKKLSGTEQDRFLTITEFSRVIHMLEEASINAQDALQALNFRHDRICIHLSAINDHTDQDLRKSGIEALKHLGDFAGELEQHLDDINDNAMEALEPKKRRLLATLETMWARIKTRHAERKAKRLHAVKTA